MTKKLILTVSVIVICMLIGLNICTIFSSKKISKYVDESSLDTQSIVIIDNLRTNINKLSQAQKLYLLTSKEEYKTKYYEELKYVYQLIDDMEQYGRINTEEKNELINVVNEYDELDKTLTSVNAGDVITPQVENEIIKSNNAQLNILQQLDKSVESTNKDLLDKNNTITSSSEFQSIWIQVVSTIITGIGSAFAYYIKVYSKKSNGKLGEIVNCISDMTDEDNNNNDEMINVHHEIVNVDKQNDYYKKCMEDLMKYEKMLEDAKLIYLESTNMKNKIKEVNNTINKIEITLDKLKEKIENIESCSSEIKKYVIEDIEDEITNLKVLFQALPIYNDIISEISNSMKNRSNTREL